MRCMQAFLPFEIAASEFEFTGLLQCQDPERPFSPHGAAVEASSPPPFGPEPPLPDHECPPSPTSDNRYIPGEVPLLLAQVLLVILLFSNEFDTVKT